MAEIFDLPVWYKGEEVFFPAELLVMGYIHKIRVTIHGVDILFEPDEERNYRAVISETDTEKTNKLDKTLLAAIVETLHELFSD